jgi:putative flippase GtrA
MVSSYEYKFLNRYNNKIKEVYQNSLLRFLFIGFLGVIINAVIFFALADYLNVNLTIASIMAFCVAVTNNYALNHLWSFKQIVNCKLNLRSYFKYIYVNIFGLLINLIILNLLIINFQPSIKVTAQFIGIISGTSFNYFLSKMYVFKSQ